ncbi:venom protein 302 [Procambarus clarkii]|uniref:venom protein 302 n=1 Tax=Procambarus clarkii TaxID=6728 RepID=UPI001E678AE5|nr:venom protein 302-like [Procambarus clarkii]
MAGTVLLVSLMLAAITGGVGAVDCSCEHARCTTLDPVDCRSGVTKDMCGCCTVCAGVLGEECGGPWNIYGDCGTGLECHQDPCPTTTADTDCFLFYLTEPGQCVEKKRRSILDLFSGMNKAGVEEVRERRRLRLLHQLEKLK